MSEERAATREEKLAPIVAKAWQDDAFKKELISNPKAVVQKEFGIELPSGVDIQVLEESSAKLYIVLPMKPTDELNDEQLEAVAGGVCLPVAALAGCVVGGTALGLGMAQGQRRGW